LPEAGNSTPQDLVVASGIAAWPRQKVPLRFSDRDGFSMDSSGDGHHRRLDFRTLLTSDLPASKPLNGETVGDHRSEHNEVFRERSWGD
jgi:hypothetical protein